MSTVPAPSPTPETAPLSQGARVIDVFIAPSKTFTDIRRTASWWLPFLIFIIVHLAFVTVVDKKVGFRKVVENQIQMSPKAIERVDRIPAERKEEVMRQQTVGTRVFWLGFPIVILVLDLIFAGLYLGTFRLGFGSDIKYKTILAVIMYGGLPYVLKSAIASLFLLAGVNTDTFIIQNPFASNPGYFMSAGDSPFLYGLASAIDVFALWAVVLTGLGIAYAGKVKKSAAIGAVLVWYLVTILFFSGLGAAVS